MFLLTYEEVFSSMKKTRNIKPCHSFRWTGDVNSAFKLSAPFVGWR